MVRTDAAGTPISVASFLGRVPVNHGAPDVCYARDSGGEADIA